MIAAPHLDGEGAGSTVWVERELFARSARGDCALCLAASGGFEQASAGFVGRSDGWQDLNAHGRLTWGFASATGGNVALTGALADPAGVIALAIAPDPVGARTLARSSLAEGFEAARAAFLKPWEAWCASLDLLREIEEPALREAALLSAVILKVHEDRDYPGALVASLSVPWGSSTNTLGGYHLVWPRDAALAAFAFVAIGRTEDARRILSHQIATQAPDGHWAQNCYPSGAPYWTGLLLDETAFPILLAAKLREMGEPELDGTAAMVRAAARFVARSSPASPQDRWEENPGINPFTLGVAIAALVAAAAWLDGAEAEEAVDLADEWRERLGGWCFVTSSPWTRELGVAGHYVRIAPDPARLGGAVVELRNRGGETIEAARLVAMEFSYLPRLGLCAPDDPRIRDTVTVVDHVLTTATPSGTVYHRYNEDGYGEHADGAPFDGVGIGRGWPFLSGERGHLALGLGEDAGPHLATMLACSSDGGLMPEQVWDAAPIPERGLEPGRPSGSAMPLLWTHAEFLKLAMARRTGAAVERLDAVALRYAEPRAPHAHRWRDAAPVTILPAGRALVVEDAGPFTLHYGLDGWDAPLDREVEPGPFDLWRVRFETVELAGRGAVVFTRRRCDAWEGRYHRVEIAAEPPRGASPSIK